MVLRFERALGGNKDNGDWYCAHSAVPSFVFRVTDFRFWFLEVLK